MKRCLALLAFLAAVPAAAPAQVPDDVVDGSILPGWRSDSGAHMAALRLVLDPGWKTYWRAPGDVGIPPVFDWKGSGNLRSVRAHWPVPDVFWQNGMRSVGYDGEVTIPLELEPLRHGEDIRLAGMMQIGVCEEICIPVTLRLRGTMPASGAGAGRGDITAALADRPMTADEAGVGRVTCRVEPISDGLRLTVDVDMPAIAPREETVVEFSDPAVWIAEPATRRSGGTVTAVTELVPPEARPFALARDQVRITVLGSGRAVDIRGCTAG